MTPIENLNSLKIGVVEYVSPDEIKVRLDIEAPDSIALNSGEPRPFPRINGYVLISNDVSGYIVGQIEWITIENSPYPQRKGLRDFGLIDVPFPMRKMSLNQLGRLVSDSNAKETSFKFYRGVDSFPSVGDSVFLPTSNQLHCIVESGQNRRVKIGTSPLADNAAVYVDTDKLFGRHLAVLGNTGSGKSCSVAGLIRWSLEQAQNKMQDKEQKANARFIILDPNGEYSRAFAKEGNIYTLGLCNGNKQALELPLWLWNSEEWGSFIRASEKAQKPLLRRALREIRNSRDGMLCEDKLYTLRRKLSCIVLSMKNMARNGEFYEGWKTGDKLVAYNKDIRNFSEKYQEYSSKLVNICEKFDTIINSYKKTWGNGNIKYEAFPVSEIDNIVDEISQFLTSIGGVVYQKGPDEDTPIPFKSGVFADHLESLAMLENNPQFFDYLIMRVRTMIGDSRINKMIDTTIDLHTWLNNYICKDNTSTNSLNIIDLSLVPSDIIHIVTSVIARVILEALQHYRIVNEGKTLPTVLVMEEAHTFIKKYSAESDNQGPLETCCKVFEKIAREGRKFGLGLVISSQRPSELSPTVLSQCNTFLLHRISNDKDQDLVQKLVPDNLRGLLRDLPSLPSQNAILLGWATELPVLVKMNTLPKDQRPQSDDPDFWDVWTRKVKRDVDWKKIADDWQRRTETAAE